MVFWELLSTRTLLLSGHLFGGSVVRFLLLSLLVSGVKRLINIFSTEVVSVLKLLNLLKDNIFFEIMANLFPEVFGESAVNTHEHHQVELKLIFELLRDLWFSLVSQNRSQRKNHRRQEQREHKLDFKKV